MKTYGIDDAKAIIRDFSENWVEFKSDGVHLTSEMLEYDTSQVLHWKYVCELENPDAPNPLTAPALPFPFTANELTAYMLDGVGAVITSIYGNWEDGPDQAMLDSMGVQGREPRRAITDAYGAFMAAQATVGSYPAELQKRADRLWKIYSYRNSKANTREGVFADGVTRDEANARRARAIASNAELERLYSLAMKEFQAAFGAWRKAMVCQLLQPAPAQTTKTTAPVVTGSDAPAIPKNQRPDLLTPPIEKAQHGESDPFNAAVIWPKLCDMAEQKLRPFIGKTGDGLQWIDANDDPQFMSKRALSDRLRRAKKAAIELAKL
jgi:hypothetical protein